MSISWSCRSWINSCPLLASVYLSRLPCASIEQPRGSNRSDFFCRSSSSSLWWYGGSLLDSSVQSNGHPTGICESSRHPSPFCSITLPKRDTSGDCNAMFQALGGHAWQLLLGLQLWVVGRGQDVLWGVAHAWVLQRWPAAQVSQGRLSLFKVLYFRGLYGVWGLNVPILGAHWLAVSRLMVILARGHGSGKVEKQCSSLDVSCRGTAASSCGWARYLRDSWMPLLRVACSLEAK